jgi:hypothetical protein
MKLFEVGIPLLIVYLLSGCAATELRDPKTGVIVFRTQADALNISYVGPGYSFSAGSLNHSDPTRAGGDTVSKVGTGLMISGIPPLLKP